MAILGDTTDCFELVIVKAYEIHLLCSNTTDERRVVVVNYDKVHFVFLPSGGVLDFNFTLSQGSQRCFVPHLKTTLSGRDQVVLWKDKNCSPTVNLHSDKPFVDFHLAEDELIARIH